MKKLGSIIFSFFVVFLFSTSPLHAQMMGNSEITITPSAQDITDIQTGQNLYDKFQNNQVSCSNLTDADFEKIGEYLMNQSFGGNANAHIQMNESMKQMVGENGEEQMHIRLAKSATGCSENLQANRSTMMNGTYGPQMMMGWRNGFSFLPFLIQIVVLIDLLLVAVWLWMRIKK